MRDWTIYVAKTKALLFSHIPNRVLYIPNKNNNLKDRRVLMKGCKAHLSLVVRKPVFGVSDQAPHKPGCTATKDG